MSPATWRTLRPSRSSKPAPAAPVDSTPALDHPASAAAPIVPAAKPPRVDTATPKPARTPAAKPPAQPTDVGTTLNQVTSSLPTAPLDLERQANDLVDRVTAPLTDALKPAVEVKVPKIDLP